MTIKQQGGIFGRNPTFNNVTADGNLTIADKIVHAGDDNTAIRFSDADTVDIETAGFKRFTVTGDGSVQIGSTSGVTNKVFVYDSSTSSGVYIRQDGAGAIQSWHGASGAERGVFESTTGNLKLTSGNLVIGTSGKGIDFSATSGSGDSELLDDYERGTFTPFFKTTNDDMGSTGFARIGYYTKIGNVCHVGFYLFSTSLTSAGTGNLIIDGLPFTSAASVQHSLSVSRSSRFGSNPPITAAVSPSGNYIILFSTPHTTASTPTETAASDLNVSGGNQNIIYVAGSYTVA